MKRIGCLHDPANVQQTSSKCIQNTHKLLNVCWKFTGRLLDRVKIPLVSLVNRSAVLQAQWMGALSCWSTWNADSKKNIWQKLQHQEDFYCVWYRTSTLTAG